MEGTFEKYEDALDNYYTAMTNMSEAQINGNPNEIQCCARNLQAVMKTLFKYGRDINESRAQEAYK